MDRKGYETIKKVLDDAGINSSIAPFPLEREDVRFLQVNTPDESTETVLNALGDAGLMHREVTGATKAVVNNSPELRVLDTEGAGKIDFEDMNSGQNSGATKC